MYWLYLPHNLDFVYDGLSSLFLHGYLKSQQKKLIDERQLRKIFKVLIVTFEYFTEKNLQGGWEGERERLVHKNFRMSTYGDV